MPKSLWTPDGFVGLQEKNVIPINKLELSLLARLHEFAQKYGVSLVCKACDHAIIGANNDSTTQPGVSCQCREWRFVP